jgi:hypothetical protein
MTIPLKNNSLFSKTFSCLCSECKTTFVIVVDPASTGKAICPECQSEKIFIEQDGDETGDFLYTQ